MERALCVLSDVLSLMPCAYFFRALGERPGTCLRLHVIRVLSGRTQKYCVVVYRRERETKRVHTYCTSLNTCMPRRQIKFADKGESAR